MPTAHKFGVEGDSQIAYLTFKSQSQSDHEVGAESHVSTLDVAEFVDLSLVIAVVIQQIQLRPRFLQTDKGLTLKQVNFLRCPW